MAKSTRKYRPAMTRPRRALLRHALQVGLSEFSVLKEFDVSRATLRRVIDNFYDDNIEDDAWYLDRRDPSVTSYNEERNVENIVPGKSTASHARPVPRTKKVLGETARVQSETRRDDQNPPTVLTPPAMHHDVSDTSLSHSRPSKVAHIPQSQSFADAVSPFLRRLGREDLKAKFDKLEIRSRKDLLVLSEHVKDPICCQSLQATFKLPITEWIVLVKAFLDYAEPDGR
ncbi:hypothetical protein IW261DRAFT_1096789 [Armillaria novae-zelandiae]|uniref:Uncharacterized protein n=1 Tax=Armillaria novae-zelandiae TaxID=153914 RepID=A0AA39UJS3_9AGAR|nr:hypothetical protein IW261DRAFT_1096789 [Armillaria novae-zelandiae]